MPITPSAVPDAVAPPAAAHTATYGIVPMAVPVPALYDVVVPAVARSIRCSGSQRAIYNRVATGYIYNRVATGYIYI